MQWQMAFRDLTALVAISFLIGACGGGSTDSAAPAPASAPDNSSRPAQSTATPEEIPPSPDEQRAVVAETLPYADVDDQLVYGHFAFPEDMFDPLPGIIVFHERWGLDDGTRALADRLAGQGFVVLAVDLFGGQTAADVEASRTLMLPVIETPETTYENIRQAHEFLKTTAQSPSVAAVGWSFGGTWALNAAIEYPDAFDAVALYYGQLSDNETRLSALDAPVLAMFGASDRGVNAEMRNGFSEVMERLGKPLTMRVYDNAGHAFADPGSNNYNPQVADAAWAEIVAFLNGTIGGQ